MPLWEYKVITSGKGGFATPALLEKFLNDLGREEWEIIEFRSSPDNALAFTGLARRSTQRDWTLEDAAAAAAKAEAEKLRAEFAAKFQAATTNGPAAETTQAASFLDEKVAPDDGYRKPIDTSRDDDPDAPEDEGEKDEWDKLAEEDELPTFFDALKPHMRRNQRGPGMSVGTDYLAKKWGLDESDIKGALVECGLQIPADENAKPVYVEYDGDLYWVNINRRGEVWINTREKPRPVFRVVQAQKVAPETPEEPKTEAVRHERTDTAAAQPELPAGEPVEAPAAKPENGGRGLPEGPALLQRIRPHMRRNRRGPGGSGSLSFLARAVRTTEAELLKRFSAMGLVAPATHSDPSTQVVIGDEVWWLNKDGRGNLWINGREKRERDGAQPAAEASTAEAPSVAEAGAAPAAESTAAAAEVAATEALPNEPTALPVEPAAANVGETAAETAPAPAPVEAQPAETESAAATPEPANVLAAVRLLLKETRTGGFAGKVERVAEDLQRSAEELTASLVAAGLKVPEKAREKPVFVEHAGEIFWFNRNAKGELWVNAKASKFAEKGDAKAEGETAEAGAEDGAKKRRPRTRGRGRSAKSESAETPESGTAGEAPPTETGETTG